MQPNELDSMDFPLVSIIIPNFNTARFVSSALKSCIEQTYTHWEAIIVDDASKDNSARIIADFASQDTRIKPIFLESNGGVANARNLALQAASGRFIAFLDADDVWEKHKLEYQVRFMLANDVALSYGDYYVIDEEDSILGDFIPEAHITFKNMLKTCQIGNSTAVYDANKCGKVKAGQIRQDYELWLSILRDFSAQKVCFAPPPA
ncbi:glycosyltransferase family 2 protein [Helicobacter jaachi]|uniref:Glycosyltransferase family 2 protein n=1 Tax=Helicobacter jaachi TaxID=1677920 RepID=A0A4U8TDR7_9HELI|nr:glycosyltransferase family 2 protein [Helicobacter jaachi]TLD96807.1 glycosyltransferase family 2 protein [Helicobacter jaachi]